MTQPRRKSAKLRSRKRFLVSFWIDTEGGDTFSAEDVVSAMISTCVGAGVETESHGTVVVLDAGDFGAREIGPNDVD